MCVGSARCRTKEADLGPVKTVEGHRCSHRDSHPRTSPRVTQRYVHALTQETCLIVQVLPQLVAQEASHPRPDTLVKAGCCSTFRFLSGWQLVGNWLVAWPFQVVAPSWKMYFVVASMGAATGQNDAFESGWIGDGGVNCWLETAASFSGPLTSAAQPPKTLGSSWR